jgi:hypothetical protein
MELYTLIAAWSGWPPVVAILLLAIGAIIWTFERELKFKDILIEQEKNKSPDVLLNSLKNRLDIANNLLAAEGKDKEKALADLKQALAEIANLRAEIASVSSNYSLYADTAKSMEAYIGGTITSLPPKKDLIKEYPELKTLAPQSDLYKQLTRARKPIVAADMKKLITSLDKNMNLVSKSRR